MSEYEPTVGMLSMAYSATDFASEEASGGMRADDQGHSVAGGHRSRLPAPLVPLNKAELDLKRTLGILWEEIGQNPQKRYFQADLMRFLYISTVPQGRRRSGAELGEIVFSGMDPDYGHPYAERSFLERNEDVLPQLIVPDAVHVSWGTGPHQPVLVKDVYANRAFEAGAYFAIDFDERQAQQAAEQVRSLTGRPTAFLATDFTKPFNLRDREIDGKKIGNRPVIITVFGVTWGNFINSVEKTDRRPTLFELAKNIRASTEDKAVILGTLDTDKHPASAIRPYRSKGIGDLFGIIWWLAADVMTRSKAKRVSNNPQFDPRVFEQIERYDSRINAVTHAYRTIDATYAFHKGRSILIPEGTTIEIGISQKQTPDDVAPTFDQAGIQRLHPRFTYDSTTQAFFGATKGTPGRWIPMLG